MKKAVIRTLSLVLVLAMCLSVSAFAAGDGDISICASKYIDAYGANMYTTGNGNVNVYFQVIGTNIMEIIGAAAVYIYEKNGGSWDLVKAFLSSSYPSMLAHNTIKKVGIVSYKGTPGKQYYASVHVRAQINGNGQILPVTTNTVTA